MFLKKNSAIKLAGRYIKICLVPIFFLTVLMGFGETINGQERLDLTQPFKKCRVFGSNNGLARFIASDNVSKTILSLDEFSLITLDFSENAETWRTETGGHLEDNPINDRENLFFLTSTENENGKKIFTLNSISLLTGISIWQKRFNNYSEISILPLNNSDQVYLSAGEKNLLAVNKTNGNIIWEKEFPAPLLNLENFSDSNLMILTENLLYQINKRNGEINKIWKPWEKPTNITILKDSYIYSGNLKGEIAKLSFDGKKRGTIWKIRTGGSISDLFELEGGILVASLDNFLYLLSSDNGKVKWKRRLMGRITIKPSIYGNLAIVVSSADNLAAVVDLSDGKIVNRIQVEDDNYFSGQAVVIGNQVALQTYKGIYFYINSNLNCP